MSDINPKKEVCEMAKVKIYTTPTCPWCKKTKEFLKSNKIPYTELNVADNENARNKMIEKSGQMGVPVVEIGDKIIVGYNPDAIKKALGSKEKKEPAVKKVKKTKVAKRPSNNKKKSAKK